MAYEIYYLLYKNIAMTKQFIQYILFWIWQRKNKQQKNNNIMLNFYHEPTYVDHWFFSFFFGKLCPRTLHSNKMSNETQHKINEI